VQGVYGGGLLCIFSLGPAHSILFQIEGDIKVIYFEGHIPAGNPRN